MSWGSVVSPAGAGGAADWHIASGTTTLFANSVIHPTATDGAMVFSAAGSPVTIGAGVRDGQRVMLVNGGSQPITFVSGTASGLYTGGQLVIPTQAVVYLVWSVAFGKWFIAGTS